MSKQAFNEEDFLITDPEKHPRVVLEVPPGVRPLRLEPIGYAADREVRCAFCPQRQRHIRGFFAVLPDGSLALCGNCCAVEISDKETVTKISRDIRRREVSTRHMMVIRELTRGLPEILEVLERDFLPLEHQVNATVSELEHLLPSSRGTWKSSKKLSFARGGLVSVLGISKKLDDRGIEAVLEKRRRIFDAIQDGIQELIAAARELRVGPVKHVLSNMMLPFGYEYAQLRNDTVVVGMWGPDPFDDEMEIIIEKEVQLPRVAIPDGGELLAMVM